MAQNDSVRPRVVVLTPVFNESENLPAYERAVRATLLDHPRYDVRVLLVDDGSSDSSWEVIKDICARDERFTALRLSRNFGSHTALSAGFHHARGDAVATLACDLQDPPEVVLEFLERWEKGAAIVWGKRRSRQDTGWRVAASNLFFNLVRRHAMPKGSKFTTGSFLLVDERVARCMRRYRERNRITFALVAWTGFDQDVVEYDRKARERGVSAWSFGKMMKAMYDTFIGFSQMPIKVMTMAGVCISGLSLLMLAWVLMNWMRTSVVPGWSSVMATLTLFFGLQFLMMGLVGEYLSRIYAESLRRPLYFVSEELGVEPLCSCDGEAGDDAPDA